MNLKINGELFTAKSVGTGPSSYEKKNLPDRGLTEVEKQWARVKFHISWTEGMRGKGQ